MAAGWWSQNGLVCVLRQRLSYFRRGGMAWKMFGWQPVSNAMEGRGTVSAGHGALRLHAYLVHCIAYGARWLAGPYYGERREAQLFMYPRLHETSWLATVVSLGHTGGWHQATWGWFGEDCELTQGVNTGQEKGFCVVLCKLWTLVAFITAAMDAVCSTAVPVGTRLHWSTDSRPVWVCRDGMASVVDGRRSVAGELK